MACMTERKETFGSVDHDWLGWLWTRLNSN